MALPSTLRLTASRTIAARRRPIAPEFAEVFADAPQPENFLAQARRSARAAAEKAESERRGRFRLSKRHRQPSEEKTRSRYLLTPLVALLVVVAAAAP